MQRHSCAYITTKTQGTQKLSPFTIAHVDHLESSPQCLCYLQNNNSNLACMSVPYVVRAVTNTTLMTLHLARIFLVASVVGANHSPPPNHPDFRSNELTLHHDEAILCGTYKWGTVDFDCASWVKYLIQYWMITKEKVCGIG